MLNFSITRRYRKISKAIAIFVNKRLLKKEFTSAVLFSKWIEVDRFTYGEPKILVFPGNATSKIYIGKFCSIAQNVEIFTGGNHNVNWVTTYPFSHFTKEFPDGRKIVGFPSTKGDVKIGNDVWIGRGVTILSGITIGDGAVIGANCTVSSNVEPYSIVVGNPMRILRKRFNDSIITKLLEIKWWNWDVEKINTEVTNLCSNNVAEFVEKHYINLKK